MADVTQRYVSIFTPFGKEVAMNAYSGGTTIRLAYMGIGKGKLNPTTGVFEEYIPTFGQTQLENEWHEQSINDLFIAPNNPYWLVAEGIIPENVGGEWIREVSLKDENRNTIIIASWPSTYKPLLAEGGSTAMVVRSTIEVNDTEVFELTIDTSLAMVTRDEFLRHVDNVTDAHNASVPPVADTLVRRDSGGRVQAGTPIGLQDAATLKEIQDVISLIEQAGDPGSPLWTTYVGDGTATAFTLMGLTSDKNYAILVFLDGVKQIADGSVYSIDLTAAIPTVNFITPPPGGVHIEIFTVVALTQYPKADTVICGVVKLATGVDSTNAGNVVTADLVFNNQKVKIDSTGIFITN
jgi:phage-related tail fiber protein